MREGSAVATVEQAAGYGVRFLSCGREDTLVSLYLTLSCFLAFFQNRSE